MTRVSIIATPIAQPGICCLCGSAHNEDRSYVDFGKQLDWYGAVYFCTICFTEIANMCGYVQVEKVITYKEELSELEAKYTLLSEKYEIVEKALYAIGSSNCGEYSNSTDVSSSASTPVAEPDINVPVIKRAAKGNSKTDSPASVEGSSDVFDLADFDESADSPEAKKST